MKHDFPTIAQAIAEYRDAVRAAYGDEIADKAVIKPAGRGGGIAVGLPRRKADGGLDLTATFMPMRYTLNTVASMTRELKRRAEVLEKQKLLAESVRKWRERKAAENEVTPQTDREPEA